MIKPILFALLFIVIGLVVFSLIAPLIFRGADLKKIGAVSFPFIVAICGLAGLLFGLRRKKKQ